ncbi:hypothetical protein PGB34_03475 [Xenophilus arseniciresistens]|uniref:Uncharacterized protein n=1 Tax=Xenophilus arseniciresistens TaxID=1283306 RepID=A0AAE3SYE5_9BURK|nr:hypothetical protein [Xenophilus arseniciresistens]MDA7415415.1 hypothetical protein [Xenophilus arseniciresistens]
MELLLLIALLAIAFQILKTREQRQRIALLGQALGKYQIEQLMENLTEGYMRWLDEQDAERKAQIWGVLEGTEQALAGQFSSFAREFQQTPAPLAQVSKLSFAIPFAQQLLPGWRLFDARKAFAIHARGIEANLQNVMGLNPKARAFMMTAELYLMQHTCHWFCRSRAVANARLMARHQTHFAQVLEAVSPQTREAYRALTGV